MNKDQEENGYAYIKKQCMHCVDPNCVSVCPVSALKKDPKTGIVHYDKDVCTGCRYCMVACPYNVPKYDYNNRLARFTSVSCVTRKALSVWIKAVCLGVWKFVRQGPSFSVLVKS